MDVIEASILDLRKNEEGNFDEIRENQLKILQNQRNLEESQRKIIGLIGNQYGRLQEFTGFYGAMREYFQQLSSAGGASRFVPCDVPGVASGGVPRGVLGGVPRVFSGGVPNGVPDGVPSGVPGDVPGGVLGGVASVVSGDVLYVASSDVLCVASGGLPRVLSGDVSRPTYEQRRILQGHIHVAQNEGGVSHLPLESEDHS